jgi:hypothetical protein
MENEESGKCEVNEDSTLSMDTESVSFVPRASTSLPHLMHHLMSRHTIRVRVQAYA